MKVKIKTLTNFNFIIFIIVHVHAKIIVQYLFLRINYLFALHYITHTEILLFYGVSTYVGCNYLVCNKGPTNYAEKKIVRKSQHCTLSPDPILSLAQHCRAGSCAWI